MQILLHLPVFNFGRIQINVHALLGPQSCLMKSLFVLLKNYMIVIARRNRCLLSLLLDGQNHLVYVGLS
jgi:hypothetical protein